jgi:DNA repair protein RecO (recombination protein O)
MPDLSTDAILLKKIEYGDHDLIINFFTQANGKMSVMAKNAKKSVKRFSGALDLFSLDRIDLRFPKRKGGSMTILCQADLENGFANIRYNVFKTAYASFWAELINAWLEEGKAQPDLYDLLLFSLGALDAGNMKMEVISLVFQIRFMSISGFSPCIDYCNECRTGIDHIDQKNIVFDLKQGRIICAKCLGTRKTDGIMISKGTLKQLFWINTADENRMDRIRFSDFAISEGQRLLEAFIPFHIGKDFKSLKFLRQLRREK